MARGAIVAAAKIFANKNARGSGAPSGVLAVLELLLLVLLFFLLLLELLLRLFVVVVVFVALLLLELEAELLVLELGHELAPARGVLAEPLELPVELLEVERHLEVAGKVLEGERLEVEPGEVVQPLLEMVEPVEDAPEEFVGRLGLLLEVRPLLLELRPGLAL